MKQKNMCEEVIKWLKQQGAFADLYKEDLVFFCKDGFYGFIECKAKKTSTRRPGQPQFIAKMAEWSYGKFVHKDNLQETFKELGEMLK